MVEIEIDGKRIGKEHEPYIIAEVGINHNGDVNLAKEMIIAAKESGADAVKFQTFCAKDFIQDRSIPYTYKSQGREITESMLDMFQRNEFSEDEWYELKHYCDKHEITFLSTPQNISDLKLLLRIGISAVKIGSDDFVNIPLVREFAKANLPMILSCGMAYENEIRQIITEIKNNPVVLFLCTSQYPTPPDDVNILRISTIIQKFPDVIPGLSDHTQGVEAAIMAVALGAKVFEKHFTMNHNMQGPDHWFSEEPDGLKQWVECIRKSSKMKGFSELKPTKSEMEMRKIAHRSITTSKYIKIGSRFSEENLCMRRPGTGIEASKWDWVIGKRAIRDLEPGYQIHMEDISDG